MDIYVVQENDTIYSISAKFGVSVTKLIQDNELENPGELVTGQSIVIVYPQLTYTVQAGDTLTSIAEAFQVSQMQLLRNNPFLSTRNLYPGEVITISYETTGKLATNGFVYPYIDNTTLKKTLPYLTYITIYNYSVIKSGEIITYFDDSELIQTSKNYGTIPLMMLTTLDLQGESDIDTAYFLLSNNEYQEIFIKNMITILREKGYLGVNLIFNYMTTNILIQYENLVKNIISHFGNEEYLFFVTINPNTRYVYGELTYEEIDYTLMGQLVDNLTFLQFIWGVNYGPPEPVSSIEKVQIFSDYIITQIPPDKVSAGFSLISYDWKLPYIPGRTSANSLSISSALNIARTAEADILFDEISQSTYFTYEIVNNGMEEHHIIWSVDARSISALVELTSENGFNGISLWNLMFYFPQLWLVVNSQFEIEKYLPDNIILNEF